MYKVYEMMNCIHAQLEKSKLVMRCVIAMIYYYYRLLLYSLPISYSFMSVNMHVTSGRLNIVLCIIARNILYQTDDTEKDEHYTTLKYCTSTIKFEN